MNCIVNVSTGRYVSAGIRLLKACDEMDPYSRKAFFDGRFPAGSPAHEQKPYAFKVYAIAEAIRECDPDLILWIDASVVPVKSLARLWEKIRRDGYWLAINGWTNYEWTADDAYPDLFPECSLAEAREKNKTFPQMVGTAFGLNMRSEIGQKFFHELFRLASETNSFCGPWGNTASPAGPKYCAEMMGLCGPADVLGHRHDQTAMSVLAWRMEMKLTQCPDIFGYAPNPPSINGADERIILLGVGA
jgi:hypothetical protein